MFSVRGKKVLVMGIGLIGGGTAVTKWLLSEGARVTVTDLKSTKALSKTIKKFKGFDIIWHLGSHHEDDFSTHDIIIQNPGVSSDSPFLKIAKKHKIPVYNEAGLFFLIAKRPIIAVTGTRGKSTTSTLIYEMLKKKYPKTLLAGNRGDVPMMSVVKEASKVIADPIVLELSSWQVEGLAEVSLSPETAVLTNLYPDHLNRYGSLGKYYNAKKVLFSFQKKNDKAFLNYDNIPSRRFSKNLTATIEWSSLNHKLFNKNKLSGVYKKGDALYEKKGNHSKRIVNLRDARLRGEHNESNIAAATVVARSYVVSMQDINDVVQTFNGIWGRQQIFLKKKGITYINDTTATTPDGLIACIKTFPHSIIIAGGQNKALSYKEVASYISKDYVKALLLLPGDATQALQFEITKLKLSRRPTIIRVDSLKEAIVQAEQIAKEGDEIILSPGAASFNLFLNEFDRGEQFERLVTSG